MAEQKQPRVINKSGTTRMTDDVAATKTTRDIAGRAISSRSRRRDRVKADVAPKEFEEITINIDRVSRTVKGGRRMRFKALVAVGNKKNKVGIAVAKGGDVTSAVQKATAKAKKHMIEFSLDQETICHEVEIKSTGAHVLLKPAAPGTGIIAGGVVRSIIGLTGVKNLISKSLGSTNKVNIAYAVIEGLRQQTPRNKWVKNNSDINQVSQDSKTAKKVAKTDKSTEKTAAKTTKSAPKAAKTASKASTAKKAVKPTSKAKAAPKEKK